MNVLLVIDKAIIPGVPAKAYHLVFTEENMYFFFLSGDWQAFNSNYRPIGIEGKAASSIISFLKKKSDKKIAERLEKIENGNYDKAIEMDKKSIKIPYSAIKKVKHKPKSVMSGEAFFQFKTKEGNYKFRLYSEEEREAIVSLIEKIKPETF